MKLILVHNHGKELVNLNILKNVKNNDSTHFVHGNHEDNLLTNNPIIETLSKLIFF